MLPINQSMRLRDFVALARHAEEAGLDAVAIGEYASSDAFVLAAAIASATDRIRIETGIVSVVARSAALTAMASATVADLSDGRFALGLGAGTAVVARFHGQSFDKPLQMVTRYIADLRTLLSGEKVAETGFQLRMPLPHGVPIHVSAINPGMARLAAGIADGVLLGLLCSTRMVGEMAGIVDAARGDRSVDIVALVGAAAGVDQDAARERLRREVAGYFVVPTYARAAIDLVGQDGMAAAAAAYAAGGMDGLTAWVPDQALDQVFASGGPSGLAARITGYLAAGATSVRFNPVTLAKGDITAAMRLVDDLAAVRTPAN